MTVERKAKLFDSLLGYLVELIHNEDEAESTLRSLGMTEDELSEEDLLAKDKPCPINSSNYSDCQGCEYGESHHYANVATDEADEEWRRRVYGDCKRNKINND